MASGIPVTYADVMAETVPDATRANPARLSQHFLAQGWTFWAYDAAVVGLAAALEPGFFPDDLTAKPKDFNLWTWGIRPGDFIMIRGDGNGCMRIFAVADGKLVLRELTP